jgi:hypothetical protein
VALVGGKATAEELKGYRRFVLALANKIAMRPGPPQTPSCALIRPVCTASVNAW